MIDNLLYRQVLSSDMMTDLGNAELLATVMNGNWRFVHELNTWFTLEDGQWNRDDSRKRIQLVKLVAAEYKAQLEGLKEEYKALAADAQSGTADLTPYLEESEKAIKLLMSWIKSCNNTSRINAMFDLVRSEKDIAISLRDFDSKGQYLRVGNGVIDLRDGSFIEASPDFLMLKSCTVDYEPEADCPQWRDMIEKATLGDKEFASFLARLAGQAMLGTADKDQLMIMYGSGANCKSTFIDTLHKILGNYAKVMTPDMITGKNSKAEYYLAELAGVRLLLMSESARGEQLTEAMTKRLVDSGSVIARVPSGRPFEYQPVMTPILATNHLPHVSSDAATWRRLTLVPFNYKVPEGERIAGFRDKLVEEEGSGILNWMIEGCLDYQWQGLNPPDVVIEAKAKFQREANRVALFIDECTVEHGDSQISLQELRSLFEVWAKENGFRSMGRNLFSEELGILGYERKKSSGGLFHVRGVKLHADLDLLESLNCKDRIAWNDSPQHAMEF
jgi:putative DNA primase/helicase